MSWVCDVGCHFALVTVEVEEQVSWHGYGHAMLVWESMCEIDVLMSVWEATTAHCSEDGLDWRAVEHELGIREARYLGSEGANGD